ncbi:MAG: hypothetical protein U0359_15155 [Byssovorax sp.]
MTLRPLLRPALPLLATLVAAFFAACSSSSSGSSSTTTTTSATTGAGGGSGGGSTTAGTGGGTGTGGGMGDCHGDATQWAALTQGPIACTKNSDCCVLVNGCYSQAQIVSAANEAAAKDAWPYCDSMCNDCIPPAIVVGCDNGTCAGKEVDFSDASPDLLMDHCGEDPQVGLSSVKLHFGCGGG